mgnify:CR=1 FL=1
MRGLLVEGLDMAASGADKPVFVGSRVIAIPHPGLVADRSSRDSWGAQRVGSVLPWLFPAKANGR